MVVLAAATDLHVRAGSANWHKARLTGIGASEIAATLGVSPYLSAVKLYHLKRGDLVDTYESERMEWGKRLEAVVLDRWRHEFPEYRWDALVKGKLYRSNARPWQLCTPDALVVDRDSMVPTVVEVKTAARPNDRDERHRWGEDGSDDIPLHYRCQVMHTMDVVGAKRAYVPVLFGGSLFRCYVVDYDDDEAFILRARGAAFWRRVVNGEEPEMDAHRETSETMRHLYAVTDSWAVVLEEDVRKLMRAKALRDRAEELYRLHENRLRADMGDCRYAKVGDTIVASRSEWTQDSFNLKAFREDNPDVYAKYLQPSHRQRFTLRGLEEK